MEKAMVDKLSMASNNLTKEEENLKLAKRDPQAFGLLYDRYALSIYRYLLSRLGNVADAQDVTSQTFQKAFEMFPSYKNRGYFSAWLFSIARSKYVDFYRRRKNEAAVLPEKQVDPQPEPLTSVIESEQILEIRKMIQDLPDKEQEILRLRFVADLSFAEMSKLLNKNESAVKKSYYRLLARLQSQLEE
jgi:RNA polymerase sigma-70 factor (ECF subfamily)